jgi:hypothetical protein
LAIDSIESARARVRRDLHDTARTPESAMRHHDVIVSCGTGKEFEFRLPAAEVSRQTHEEAREWFDREFVALECDVASPIGKVLSADRVLSVAKYSGDRRFRDQPVWAQEFARNTAARLGRETIRVDVPNYSVGY